MNNTIKLIKIEETDNRTFDEVIGELKTEGYNRFNIKVTKTDMFLMAAAAPQQEAQEPVVAAVFDEQLGRPMLVEGAPLLSHGQPLYTAPQPAPESIRSILVRCREFIDTTKVPAYPAGADLADEIDVLLAAQPSPAPLSESIDQLERELAIIGVVGAIDGYDVVRRESVLEIARRAAMAAQGGKV